MEQSEDSSAADINLQAKNFRQGAMHVGFMSGKCQEKQSCLKVFHFILPTSLFSQILPSEGPRLDLRQVDVPERER